MIRKLIYLLVLFLLVVGVAAHDEYNEDQWLFEYEQQFCAASHAFMKALGSANANDACWWHSKPAGLPHLWRLDDTSHRGDARYQDEIAFKAFGYFKGDPIVSAPQVFDFSDVDSSRTISREYPPEAVTVDEEIEDSIELSIEEGSEYTTETTFNVTTHVDVSVTAGFEAGTAGVKVSGSVSADAGIEESRGKAFGHSSSETKTKTITQSITTSVDIPANSKTILLTIQVGKQQSITPIVENGYVDYSGCFTLYKWAGRTTSEHWLSDSIAIKDDSDQLCWNNVQHLLDIIAGVYEREYPNMTGFLDWACDDGNKGSWHAVGSCNFYNWLNQPEKRHVSLERQQIVVSEQAGEVTVAYE